MLSEKVGEGWLKEGIIISTLYKTIIKFLRLSLIVSLIYQSYQTVWSH